MAGVKAGDIEPEAAQFMHQPWRCRWLSEPAPIRRGDAGRVAFASVGAGRQRGLNRAADAELMLLFRWSVAGLTAGAGGA
jgi:hypothetical protein